MWNNFLCLCIGFVLHGLLSAPNVCFFFLDWYKGNAIYGILCRIWHWFGSPLTVWQRAVHFSSIFNTNFGINSVYFDCFTCQFKHLRFRFSICQNKLIFRFWYSSRSAQISCPSVQSFPQSLSSHISLFLRSSVSIFYNCYTNQQQQRHQQLPILSWIQLNAPLKFCIYFSCHLSHKWNLLLLTHVCVSDICVVRMYFFAFFDVLCQKQFELYHVWLHLLKMKFN